MELLEARANLFAQLPTFEFPEPVEDPTAAPDETPAGTDGVGSGQELADDTQGGSQDEGAVEEEPADGLTFVLCGADCYTPELGRRSGRIGIGPLGEHRDAAL